MSAEERKKILQMVSDGKINAEEAAILMRALDEPAEEEILLFQAGSSGMGGERSDPSVFEEVKRRAMRWAWFPLGIGIVFTTLFAWWMVNIQQSSGYNFLFFCLSIPLALSMFLIVAGAGSAASRWLYVNVDRSQAKDGPRKFTVAFPLPLGLVAWFLKTFGSYIEGLKKTSVDEIVQAIALTKNITEPLVINVDDSDEGGERVQVFIG